MRAFVLCNPSAFGFSSSLGVHRSHAEQRPQGIFAGKTGFVAGRVHLSLGLDLEVLALGFW